MKYNKLHQDEIISQDENIFNKIKLKSLRNKKIKLLLNS
jgi:hypothetical protein